MNMLEIREVIDRKQWEEFLNQAEHYPFFQSWNWLEVTRELNSYIQKLGLFENEKLLGVLGLVEIRARRGHYLYLREGPVLAENNKKNLDFFLEMVCKIAKSRDVSFIRMSRFPKTDEFESSYFKNRGFIKSNLSIIDAEVCPFLDITKSEEEILAGMR